MLTIGTLANALATSMNRVETLINPRANPVEWARAFSENCWADWWKRVVEYELIFGAGGEPEFEVDKGSTPLLAAEYRGTMAMRDLALLGQRWIVWISPKGGISNYPESRFCVGKVVYAGAGVKIESWGICGDQDGEKCLEIAGNFLVNGGIVLGEVSKFDDLRGQPIGFDKNDKEMWQILTRGIRIEEVWEAIGDGRVMANNELMRERISVVVAEMPEMRSGWEIQRYLEVEMRGRYGVKLMTGGNHGGSVMGTEKIGAFNRIYSGLETEVISRDGQRYCAVCGEKLSEGVTTCPKCGLKLAII